MKMKKVNFAIQVLPESKNLGKYELVDKAIAIIQNSGFVYQVCPFETVVECTLEEGFELVKNIHKECDKAGTEKMMTYLKIQSDFSDDVTIDDKMGKYKDQ